MSRIIAHWTQDLQESVARTMGWSDDLNGSTISGTPTWTLPSGLTNVTQSNTTTSATIRITATATGVYEVNCAIVTAGGESLNASAILTVTD